MATKYKPIQIYPELVLRKKIEEEAKKMRRKLGPTVIEMVRFYFAQNKFRQDQ